MHDADWPVVAAVLARSLSTSLPLPSLSLASVVDRNVLWDATMRALVPLDSLDDLAILTSVLEQCDTPAGQALLAWVAATQAAPRVVPRVHQGFPDSRPLQMGPTERDLGCASPEHKGSGCCCTRWSRRSRGSGEISGFQPGNTKGSMDRSCRLQPHEWQVL